MKPVRQMSDREFEDFVRLPREIAQQMMLATRCSPIPDRAMHPNAKMSGGDKPLPCIARWLIDLQVAPCTGTITSLNRNTAAGEIKPLYVSDLKWDGTK